MTITAKLNHWNPEPDIIDKAASIIRSGGLVSFPTETVYGLGADALNTEAVSRIYQAKGRPSDNPLILHVCSEKQASELVYLNANSEKLIRTFWPGPLTLVLPARSHIPLRTRGGLPTAAIRMPDNPTALALISASRTPIAAPSANISGRPSPTDASSVYQDMNGRIDMILDGGSVEIGIESTVIDISEPERVLLLRPGGMGREVIEEVLNMTLEVPDTLSLKKSPGTRYKHYSPDIPVIIWKHGHEFPDINASSAGYMGLHEPPAIKTADMILFKDNTNYAQGLFSGFRQFEREGLSWIVTEWPENPSGTGAGLQDRILRAAGG